MSTHAEVSAFVEAYADALPADGLAEIKHYLDHGEHEIAFEGLVIELEKRDVSPGRRPRSAWESLTERLGLREDSVLVGDFWALLSGWLDRHAEAGPDLLGVAATLLGMDRAQLASTAGEALAGVEGLVGQLQGAHADLQADDPARRAAGRDVVQALEAKLSALGLDATGKLEGRLAAAGSGGGIDPEEGKALLARGLGVLQSLLASPEEGEAKAKAFSEEMEARFGHLVEEPPGERPATREELKEHARSSIAAALSGITFE